MSGLGSPVKKDGSIDSLTKLALPMALPPGSELDISRGNGSITSVEVGMSVYVQGQGLGPAQGPGLGVSQAPGPGLGGSIEEGTSVYVQGQGLSQAQGQGLGSGLGFGSVEEGASVYVQGPGLSQGQVLGQGLGPGFGLALGQELGSVEEGTSVYVPTSSSAQEALIDPSYWDQYKSFGGGWIECFTEEGYLYYYNYITGKSLIIAYMSLGSLYFSRYCSLIHIHYCSYLLFSPNCSFKSCGLPPYLLTSLCFAIYLISYLLSLQHDY